MNHCKRNICINYKAPKSVGNRHYVNGVKRCTICEIFLKWEGAFCPCCGHRMKNKPKSKKFRELREIQRIG